MKPAVKTVLIVAGALVIAGAAWLFSGTLYQFAHKIPLNVRYVTDPANPAFKIENFDPRHYVFQEDLADALEKLFPKGTPRQEIDRVLLSKPGIKVEVPPDDSRQGDNNGDAVIIYLVPKFPELRPHDYPNSACYVAVAKTHWRYFFHFRAAGEGQDNLILEKITWSSC